MPYDVAGNFTRVHNWTADRDALIRILADRHDAEDDNFSGALNQAFLRDGRVALTGSLKLNGNDITGLGDGSAGSPAIRFANDTNTGFYRVGNDTLGLSVGGVLRLRLDAGNMDVTANIRMIPASGNGNMELRPAVGWQYTGLLLHGSGDDITKGFKVVAGENISYLDSNSFNFRTAIGTEIVRMSISGVELHIYPTHSVGGNVVWDPGTKLLGIGMESATKGGDNIFTGLNQFNSTCGDIVFEGNVNDGIAIQLRADPGKGSELVFIENTVDYRWALGCRPGNSAFYFANGFTVGDSGLTPARLTALGIFSTRSVRVDNIPDPSAETEGLGLSYNPGTDMGFITCTDPGVAWPGSAKSLRIDAGNIIFNVKGTSNATFTDTTTGFITGTTASAANMFQNLSNGNVLRSTSALKYKTDIRELTNDAAEVALRLRPVMFKSLASEDDPDTNYLGLIAEEVDKVAPWLVHYVEGEPDGVQYERLAVMLLQVVKRQDARIASLEKAFKDG